MFNIRNFADFKRLITLLGVANAKKLAPLLVGMILKADFAKGVVFKDATLVEKQLTELVTLIIEITDNVDSVS